LNAYDHQADASGYQYKRNRYYDPSTGRFTQEDPIGLAGGLNTYGFAGGDPVNFSDPFGLDAIEIRFNLYPIAIGGVKIPLAHYAVIAVSKTGVTKYYEYGRYVPKGEVRARGPIPNLTMGKDGKPTKESLDKLYGFVAAQYGKGTSISPTYHDDADFDKVVKFAEDRMKDKNREDYNIATNSCRTFCKDAVKAGKAP
jgi:RHS repeat-associated protein